MTSSHALSRPERGCARTQARHIRERVRDDGGCCYCTRRAGIFENVGRRAVCGISTPKAFPACVSAPGGFDFDEPAYREAVKP